MTRLSYTLINLTIIFVCICFVPELELCSERCNLWIGSRKNWFVPYTEDHIGTYNIRSGVFHLHIWCSETVCTYKCQDLRYFLQCTWCKSKCFVVIQFVWKISNISLAASSRRFKDYNPHSFKSTSAGVTLSTVWICMSNPEQYNIKAPAEI